MTPPNWPPRMSPSLAHSCASSSLPNYVSWLLMSSTTAWWPWPPASTSLNSTGQILFSWSSKHLGRTGSQRILRFLDNKSKNLRYIFLIYWRNQSEWSPEMMEDLGPLLLWDDESTAALPNQVSVPPTMVMQWSCRRFWSYFSFLCLCQPWMKDVFFFLKLYTKTTKALRKKMFDLITSSPNMARKKRAGETETSCVCFEMCLFHFVWCLLWCFSPPGSLSASSRNPPVPTVESIKELGQNNVFWTSQQLDLMTPEDFRATVETFGSIPDFDSEQLIRLKAKAVQVIMSTGPNSAHLGGRGPLVGLALNSLVLRDSHMFYSF